MFKVIKLSLSLAVLSLIVACNGEQQEQATNQADSEQTKPSSNSSKASSDSESTEKSEKKVTQYNIFNKEDTAGSLKVEKNGNLVKANLRMGWNNRRIETDEIFTLDEKGLLSRQEIKGISAFGAPIDESFTSEKGVASWKSLNEQGQDDNSEGKFFIAIDGTNIAKDYLVKALLKDPDNSIELLPSGQASLSQLKSVTLTNGEQQKQVHLIGINGLGFSPEFAWYDEQYNFFATDGGGWFGIIPEGWGREHLEQLSKVQKEAENEHLKALAERLTNKSEKPILLTNANYVDVKSGQLVTDKIILIEQGKISLIAGQDKASSIKQAVTLIDAKGKTIIPGLWDMHGHLSKGDGLLNIPAGVTSVRDMGNTHDNITDIQLLSISNEIIGSDVYRSGFMDRESPFAMKMGKTVDSLESAKEAVDWYAENGYPQIKTYSSMEPSWVKPLAEHIHSKGMRLSGHIPAFMTAEEAVKAGFDEIQHINMLFLNFLGKEVDTRKRLRFTLVGERGYQVDIESKEVADFMALLKEHNITIDPTLSVFRTLLLAKSGVIDPEMAAIYEHLPVSTARDFKKAILDIKDEQREAYNQSAEALSAMVKKLHDSGVNIVAGTDNLAGFTLHRELIAYSEAGIDNASVLKLATIGSATVVGQQANTGSIEVGKNSDLLLIDGNPLQDMNDLRKVALVIKGQKLYQPEQIYQAIGVKPFTPAVELVMP